jgi:hypothetical protein
VIANPKKNRDPVFLERSDLHLDEVIPCADMIFVYIEAPYFSRSVEFALKVLVGGAHGAEVPQMPVKRRLVAGSAVRNRRHDEVSAIARITRDHEVPFLRRWSRRALWRLAHRRTPHKQEKGTKQY